MNIRTFAFLTLSASLSACQSAPQVQTGDDAEVIGENLHRVDNSRVDKGYVDPDVDFRQYDKVLIQALIVDDVKIIQPTTSSSRPGRHEWELTDKDRVLLQDAFQASMTKQLTEDDGYTLATGSGEGVLDIVAKLIALAPNAPKDDFDSRAVGRSRVFTEGSGAATIEIAFADSVTGKVLAVAVDSRAGNSTWGINNSVTNRADMQRMFNSWALQIRKRLDAIHGKD